MTTALRTGQAPVPRAAFTQLVVNEARLAWRSPRGVVFGISLPIGMLVLFGELPGYKQHPASLGGLSRFDAEVPVLAAFIIAALALLALPAPLATYRERGILRRMSTTPVRPG
jgi:ABC-2 type transport system permease protein